MPDQQLSTTASYDARAASSTIELKIGLVVIESYTYSKSTNSVMMSHRPSEISLTPNEFRNFVIALRVWLAKTIGTFGPASSRSSDYGARLDFDPSAGEVTVGFAIEGMNVSIYYEQQSNVIRWPSRSEGDLKWSDFLRFADSLQSLVAILEREYPAAF